MIVLPGYGERIPEQKMQAEGCRVKAIRWCCFPGGCYGHNDPFFPRVMIRRSRPSVVALLSNGNHQVEAGSEARTRTGSKKKPGSRVSSNSSGGIEGPRRQAKIRLRVEAAAALAILIYIGGSHLPSSINGHVQYLVCAREAPSPNSTPAL